MINPKTSGLPPLGSTPEPTLAPPNAALGSQDVIVSQTGPSAVATVGNAHTPQLHAAKQRTAKELRTEMPAPPPPQVETSAFQRLFERVQSYRENLQQVQSHEFLGHGSRSPNIDLDEYAYDMMRAFTAAVERRGLGDQIPKFPGEDGRILHHAMVYASIKQLDAPVQAFAAIKRSAEHVVATFDAYASALTHDDSAMPRAQAAFLNAWAAHLEPAKAFEAQCDALDPVLKSVRNTWGKLNEYFYAKLDATSGQRDARQSLFSTGWSYFWHIMPEWRQHVSGLNIDMRDDHAQRSFMRFLECAYIPQRDNHTDLVAACEAAKLGTERLRLMGSAIAHGDLDIAHTYVQPFQLHWNRFNQHQKLYDKDSEPRDFVVPELGIHLDAASLRAFLVEDTSTRLPANTPDEVLNAVAEQELSSIAGDVRRALAKEPPDFLDAYFFTQAYKEWLARAGTTDTKAVHDGLDLEPLRRKSFGDRASAADFYEVCAHLVAQLSPSRFERLDLQRYEGAPVNRLAEAMEKTGRVVLVTKLEAMRQRARIGPQLIAEGIAFEQANLQHALSKRDGRLGNTDHWLNEARQYLSGTTAQERHAAAVGYLLLQPSALHKSTCPENLRGSLDELQNVSKKLEAFLVFATAEELFVREARQYQVAVTPADKINLQRDLINSLDTVFYNVNYEQVTSLVLQRLKDISKTRSNSNEATAEKLPEAFDRVHKDLKSDGHQLKVQKRADMVGIVAKILRHDAIDSRPTPWLSQVAQESAPLRMWVAVDWQVHRTYYEPRLGSA